MTIRSGDGLGIVPEANWGPRNVRVETHPDKAGDDVGKKRGVTPFSIG